MNYIFVVGAFLAGAVLPLQTLINGRLSGVYGSPVLAGATSFQIGALALFAAHFAFRTSSGSFRLTEAPPWIWAGGLLGAIYMVGAIASVPKLGAASMISLVVLGQVLASILLDHYGVLSQIAHPVSAMRLGGALLVIAGVWLVTHY